MEAVADHGVAGVAADRRQVLVTVEHRPVPEAEACASVGFDPAGGAIDYLVRAEDRDRGLGPTILRAFTDEVALGQHPGWPAVCSGPEPDNVRSWRALEKAGFTYLGDIVTEDGPEHLMARDR